VQRLQVGEPRRPYTQTLKEFMMSNRSTPAEMRRVLVEEIAENMSIYAGTIDPDRFVPQAEQLLSSFEAMVGRLPNDYLEIEDWSRNHLDKGGRFLVLRGSRD
jgi:hypothetical protein